MQDSYTYNNFVKLSRIYLITVACLTSTILNAGQGFSRQVAFSTTDLKTLAAEGKYGQLLTDLYAYRNSGSAIPVTIAEELAQEGHAPCMYFLVRDWANSYFGNYNPVTIRDAIYWALISLACIRGDIQCCKAHHINTQKSYLFFCQKYNQKFGIVSANITLTIIEEALMQAKDWFVERDFCCMDNAHQTKGIYASPKWVAGVSITGFSTLTFDDHEVMNLTTSDFLSTEQEIRDKRKYGIEKFFSRVDNTINSHKQQSVPQDWVSLLFPSQLYSAQIQSTVMSYIPGVNN